MLNIRLGNWRTRAR